MQDLKLTNENFRYACELYAAQDYTTAIKVCRRLILNSPKFAQSYHMLGLIYLQQENFARAINYLLRANVFSVFNSEMTYNLAYCYHKNQQQELAIPYYEKVLLHAPEHKAARFNLACALNEIGEDSAAISEYQQVIVSNQGNISALYNIATSYKNLHKFKQATKFYQAILELDTTNPKVLNNLGICFQAQNRLDKAYFCFLAVLKYAANNAVAYNNLGGLCILENKLDLAISFFRKAIKNSIKYKAAWLNLAKAYRLKYDAQNANKCYNKILACYSDDTEAKYFHNPIANCSSKYFQTYYDTITYNYAQYFCIEQKYLVPKVFKKLLVAKKITAVNSILDLGCGTGWLAQYLKNSLNSLEVIGVDLANNMLELAKQTNLYTDLYLDNINHFLQNKTKKYDLILAADVLNHQGCLKNIFRDIANSMHQDSHLLISTEIATTNSFSVKFSGRFGHSFEYIKALAVANGLQIIKYTIINIRYEYDMPIPGYCLILTKNLI